MTTKAAVILTACVLLPLSARSAEPPQDIRVSGGGAAISGTFLPVVPGFRQDTGTVVSLRASTPAQGLADLEQGKADVAVGAVTLDDMINGAEKLGVRVDPGTLALTPMGTTRRLVFVHRSNPLTKLSKDQLKRLFTGRVTNWKEVGGNDEPVVVVWGSETPGQNDLLSRVVLDGEPVTPLARKAKNYRDIIVAVMNTPGAVGLDPEGYANGGIRVVETLEMKSPIIAVTKSPPALAVRGFLDYVIKVNAEF